MHDQAKQDLSQAHLMQHFATAQRYATASNITVNGQGTWSTNKPNDTLEYTNGVVNGTKHWVSGVKLCDWVIVVAKEHSNLILVKINTRDIDIIPVSTVGMEDTLTVNFKCSNTPAIRLLDKGHDKYFLTMSMHELSFITNHLGLARSLLKDIADYTNTRFDYDIKKLRLEIDILEMLWKTEVETLNEIEFNNHNEFWNRRAKIYGFAKKVLSNVTAFITEVTGSSLFVSEFPGHQRFKDGLIYSTHQRNLSVSLDQIYSPSITP